MGVKLPKPGTMLLGDDGAVVIQRGWSDAKILEAIAAIGWETPPTTYTLARWHLWSQAMTEERYGRQFDQYWSSDGDCRTSIDVAIPIVATP